MLKIGLAVDLAHVDAVDAARQADRLAVAHQFQRFGGRGRAVAFPQRPAEGDFEQLRTRRPIAVFPLGIVFLVLLAVALQPLEQDAAVDLAQGVGQAVAARLGQRFGDGLGQQPLIVRRGQRDGRLRPAAGLVHAAVKGRQQGMGHLPPLHVVDFQFDLFQRLHVQHLVQEELVRAIGIAFQFRGAEDPVRRKVGLQRLGRRFAQHAFGGDETIAILPRQRELQAAEDALADAMYVSLSRLTGEVRLEGLTYKLTYQSGQRLGLSLDGIGHRADAEGIDASTDRAGPARD